MDPDGWITVTADVWGGKSCIRGTRITVYDVLEYLAVDMAEADLLGDIPTGRPEHVGPQSVGDGLFGRRACPPVGVGDRPPTGP